MREHFAQLGFKQFKETRTEFVSVLHSRMRNTKLSLPCMVYFIVQNSFSTPLSFPAEAKLNTVQFQRQGQDLGSDTGVLREVII